MDKKDRLHALLATVKSASAKLAIATTEEKNRALLIIAEKIRERAEEIQSENARDVESSQKAGRPEALIDRLKLTPERVEAMAETCEYIASLPDSVGELVEMKTRPNGLRVARMRVPLGVIGIIFESRPNVVVDAAALCLKSGNAVVLRGGSEAAFSNNILGRIINQALVESALLPDCVKVIEDTDRDLVLHLLQARGLVDLVIPRGGESLIRFVDENAKVPTIFHYKGVCHVFIDKDADLEKALPIVINAKVQRPGVCNAMETLLIVQSVAEKFWPTAAKALEKSGVEIRGCEKARALYPQAIAADESDWEAEYLDLILAVRIVIDYDEAMAHIAKYGSGHTESIITENYTTAGRFLREASASCVMVNASTRFNDGGELGLGAEIGISTTKLHAYGPMGLEELTCKKFIVLGNGQVRG